jgi:ankyrin repeat protein
MKKIIILLTCILNIFCMNSPKNLSPKDIEFMLEYTPFERAVAAIYHNDKETLQGLISRNPKLLDIRSRDFFNSTLYNIAIFMKKNDIAKSLIRNDISNLAQDFVKDPVADQAQNSRNVSPGIRLSPLHIAAEFDDNELAKFLINNGECPESFDENGFRPITVARNRYNKKVFKTCQNHIDGYMGDNEMSEKD